MENKCGSLGAFYMKSYEYQKELNLFTQDPWVCNNTMTHTHTHTPTRTRTQTEVCNGFCRMLLKKKISTVDTILPVTLSAFNKIDPTNYQMHFSEKKNII